MSIKRYALFNGNDGHYHFSSWEALEGIFDTVDEARAVAEERWPKCGLYFSYSQEWWEVVDLHTGKIVMHTQCAMGYAHLYSDDATHVEYHNDDDDAEDGGQS